MDDPEILALLPAIREQATSPDTPYVQETIEDLIANHEIEEPEAHYMVAFCLADELEKMAREERSFDAQRYKTLLSLLPHLPE